MITEHIGDLHISTVSVDIKNTVINPARIAKNVNSVNVKNAK